MSNHFTELPAFPAPAWTEAVRSPRWGPCADAAPAATALLDRDFRRVAASEGTTVEIECVKAPDPGERLSGEWLFHVVNAEGERFMLITALARERLVSSPIGMFGLAFGKLNLDHLDVPAVVGDVRGGMRSRPGGSDPLE